MSNTATSWRGAILIDNPARIELRNQHGPYAYAEARKNRPELRIG